MTSKPTTRAPTTTARMPMTRTIPGMSHPQHRLHQQPHVIPIGQAKKVASTLLTKAAPTRLTKSMTSAPAARTRQRQRERHHPNTRRWGAKEERGIKDGKFFDGCYIGPCHRTWTSRVNRPRLPTNSPVTTTDRSC